MAAYGRPPIAGFRVKEASSSFAASQPRKAAAALTAGSTWRSRTRDQGFRRRWRTWQRTNRSGGSLSRLQRSPVECGRSCGRANGLPARRHSTLPAGRHPATKASSSSPVRAFVPKDDREWNLVTADIVQGEHIDDGTLLGRRRAVPFRFRHSPPLPGGSKRLAWSQSPHIGGDKFILHGTGGNGSRAVRPRANKGKAFPSIEGIVRLRWDLSATFAVATEGPAPCRRAIARVACAGLGGSDGERHADKVH